MKRWLRPFAALLVAVILPLQVMAAAAMPACGMDRTVPEAAEVPDCHGVDHDAAASAEQASNDGSIADCDACGLCHLACSPALSSFAAPDLTFFGATLVATRLPFSTSFQPEPAERPPFAG
ncbi:MAG: hypothetical protein KIT73_07775 [Burkholderiales bacterium]|nr:hypothetical protein [Burkholderiales bacterium]